MRRRALCCRRSVLTRAPTRLFSRAERIDFLGSIKWRDEHHFDRRDGGALAAKISSVPGATISTKLLGVSRQGFKQDSGLDIEIGPKGIIAAYSSSAT
jgi:uncharacterized protein